VFTREWFLVAAVRALTQDLSDELELTSCLANFGEECLYSDRPDLVGEEMCSVCAKWDTIEAVARMMQAGGLYA
jgi:hypothetical protein